MQTPVKRSFYKTLSNAAETRVHSQMSTAMEDFA